MNRLRDKVAIITGAGSGTGMGAVTARLFADEGAIVVVTDSERGWNNLEALAQEINSKGQRAFAAVLDVTSRDQWASVVEKTLDRYDRIDILVNNAGTMGRPCPWDEATLEDVQQIMNVNLNGPFLGIKAVAPAMKKQSRGSIVNIASMGALIVFPGLNPGYPSSKGACRQLTKSAAVDYAKWNIRVNGVYPGTIETPMADVLSGATGQDLAVSAPSVPMGRVGRPEEVATAVLYLASDEASYVTAAELVVDGGYTAL